MNFLDKLPDLKPRKYRYKYYIIITLDFLLLSKKLLSIRG